jgi:hypothetical protein
LINCRLIGVTQLPVVLVRVRDECGDMIKNQSISSDDIERIALAVIENIQFEDVIELIWMCIENYSGVELLPDSEVEQLIITIESKVDSIKQSRTRMTRAGRFIETIFESRVLNLDKTRITIMIIAQFDKGKERSTIDAIENPLPVNFVRIAKD